MTSLTMQLDDLLARIKAAEVGTRYRFQPQLDHLITSLEQDGRVIKAATRELNEELQNDAIEAQFDNMPV